MTTRLNEQTGTILLIYLIVLFIVVIEYLEHRAKLRGRLSRGSIKEAIDTLPMAVCYFLPSGMVKLCNKQMEVLFRFLTDMDLQCYSEFEKVLSECNEKTSVKRLKDEKDTYLFPDGKAWHYMEKVIITMDTRTYREVLFMDVTDLYKRGQELKGQVGKLQKLAVELKELSDNALIIARENEILTAKTRLHDQMGAGLIGIRHFLLHGGSKEEAREALYPLRRAISLIKYDTEEEDGNELAELIHDAKVIGVRIELKIETGKWKEKKSVFILAMRECLTNAVKYADATVLKCSIKEKKENIVLNVTNNGMIPKGDIKPRGGLKNLLRTVNNCGGSMRIISKPFFVLSISIPYGKE